MHDDSEAIALLDDAELAAVLEELEPKRVNNEDLIDDIAKRTGMSVKVTRAFLVAFTDVLLERITLGLPINLTRWGRFEVRQRAARRVRPPNSPEARDIPPRNYLKFTPFKALKDRIR